MAPWHDEDRFWETFHPSMFPEACWERAASDIDGVLALAGVAPGAAVLDLACGPGRHCLELARRGYRVTGVDRTAAFLEEAHRRAAAEGLQVEWVQADMRRFCRPEAFDLAINLYTAFGYFEDPAEDRQVARNLYQSLRPGGVLVMELMGKEVLARIFRERDWREEPDGALLLEERRVCPGWDWIECRWIRLEGERRTEYRLSHRLYSAAELSGLLRDVGFTTVTPSGDLAGAPYDPTAKRLVLLGRR